MQAFIMTAQLLLALTILVGIHEFGHYIAARMFGVRVEKFFIFFDAFGKKLLSFKKGETEYGIGWLPLGGYVKISGMIDESMDKSYQDREPQDWEFRSKKPWQKLIIMLAGIFLNIVLGVLIFTGINVSNKQFVALENIKDNYEITDYGKEIGLQKGDIILGANGKSLDRIKDIEYKIAFGGSLDVNRGGKVVQLPIDKNHFQRRENFLVLDSEFEVLEVAKNSNAAKAGLQKGDSFVSLNGMQVDSFEQFGNLLDENKNQEVKLTFNRAGEENKTKVQVADDGKIGFTAKFFPSEIYKPGSPGLGKSIKYGFTDAFNIVIMNARAFVKMGRGEMKVKENLGGPVKIATMFGSSWDWSRFWSLTAALSMVLAFMNILPIPALDGGHAVFATYEWIMGKPVNDKFLEIAQTIGFFLLMALMVFIFWNDITSLLNK